jgi:hypothetical protein
VRLPLERGGEDLIADFEQERFVFREVEEEGQREE